MLLLLPPLVAVLLLFSTVQAGKLYYNPTPLHNNNGCPAYITTCTDGTCCPIGPNSFACCPYKNAECCPDQSHCCPEGYTCDVTYNQCINKDLKKAWHNTSSTIKNSELTNKAAVVNNLNFFAKGFTHEQPLKEAPKCQANHTVCPLENGHFGCCHYSNAVCCGDGGEGFCCPNGHTCNVESKKCEKPALKVAKTDDLLPKSFSDDPLPKSFSDNICPDAQNSCSSNATCCRLADGEYGCCSYPHAVCCSDLQHCCPHYSICDISSQTCILQKDSKPFAKSSSASGKSQWRMVSQVEGSNLVPPPPPLPAAALSAVMKDTLCPDNSSCSENDTCCAMNTGVWGCCSYKYAVCCADYMHCCPQNFICELTEKRCAKKHLAFPLSKLRTAKQAKSAAASSS